MSVPPSTAAMSVASPLVAIVGATATGKSQLAIDLARALDGEILNADALQLYRGMDIGTAKQPPEDRGGIPHLLLDLLEVTEEASVSAYQDLARNAIAEVRARGRVPILVGGSGLYLRAVLDRIAFPPTDAAVRSRYERQIVEQGSGSLHAELARRDPEAAAHIGSRDARRIVRALEVGELTGRPFRSFLPVPEYVDPATVQIGVHRDRDELHTRVAVRVGRMVEQGLLAEVRMLREAGLDRGATARRAIGYEQALAVLDGTMTCAEAVDATVVGTRRLVRKQDTWFRRDQRVHWIDASDESVPLLDRALAVIDAASGSGTASPGSTGPGPAGPG